MANILQLPVASSVTGDEYAWIVQGGSDKRTTLTEIANTGTGWLPVDARINTPGTGGLSGGGLLSSDLTLTWTPANLTAKTAMAVTDAFAISSADDAGDPRQTTFPNAMKALTGLTALTVVDPLSDYMIINDHATGTTKKVNTSSLSLTTGNVPAGGTIGQPLVKNSSTNYDSSWQTLPVIGGGTGQITNTNHGILLGQGTSAIVATAAMTNGQLLIGQTSADPLPKTVTGDVTISNLGVTAIGAGKVTNTMLADMAQSTIKGRAASSGTGAPVDLTVVQTQTILGLATTSTDKAIVRFSGTAGATQNSGVTIDDSNNIQITGATTGTLGPGPTTPGGNTGSPGTMALDWVWYGSSAARTQLINEGFIWNSKVRSGFGFARNFDATDSSTSADGGPNPAVIMYSGNDGSNNDVTPLVTDANARASNTTVFGGNLIARSNGGGLTNVKLVGLEIDVEPASGDALRSDSGGLFINSFSSAVPVAIQLGGLSGGTFTNGIILDKVVNAGLGANSGATMKWLVYTANGTYSGNGAILLANNHKLAFDNPVATSAATMYNDTSGNLRITLGSGGTGAFRNAADTANLLQVTSTGQVSIFPQSVGGGLSTVTTGSNIPECKLYDTTDGGFTIYSQGGTLRIASVNTAGSFVASQLALNSATLTIGAAGSSLGKVALTGSTSGTTTLQPATAASGTLTLPAATDTVAVLAASQAFTNKTYNGLTITSTTGTLTVTNGKTLSISNSLTLAGTDSTTMTFPATSSTVLTTGNTATITKGYSVTPNNIGTVSSGTTTPDPANGNYQYMTNNGAFALAAPSSDCAIDILLTNGASAGSITFSGFTVGTATGSAYVTTNTFKFLISIRRINATATYSIYALQ